MATIALALYTDTIPNPVSKREAMRIHGLQRCTQTIDALRAAEIA
jgi:hypothetical protein